MSDRVGVYVCACGTNIADGVDIDELVAFAGGLSNVTVVKTHNLLCAEDGCKFLADDIRASSVDRVVVAACSPKEHEATFRRACADGGINPYLFQLANIRELAAWSTGDRDQATNKSKAYIRAAVRRVLEHEPLEERSIDAVADVLVIGAGVTGIEAALVLAQKGRTVFLVDRAPHIGGQTMKVDEVFPNMECASCMLEPKMDRVLHDEHIQLSTLTEIESVLGYYGNFIVTARKRARYVNPATCIGCGACYPACPVTVDSEFDEGLQKRKAVYVAYPGALPNVPVIDREACLHFTDEGCTSCRDICPFGDAELIDFDQQDEVVELRVGAIVVATGYDLYRGSALKRYGYGDYSDVYTSLELERLLSSNGPTSGELLTRAGSPPGSVALIQCVGRESGELDYCSGLCCASTLKLAHAIRQKVPEAGVTVLHRDWCLPGKEIQKFQRELGSQGVRYLRYADPERVMVTEEGDRLAVKVASPVAETTPLAVDMVVLSPGLAPSRGAAELAATLGVELDELGFFRQEHGRIAPVSTAIDGIYVAGCASGPADIPASMASGAAAAGQVLSRLLPGEKLELPAIVAEVDEAVCGACKVCAGLCPYVAITFDAARNACAINDALCKGCGTCVAACPAGAARSRHFTTEQLFAEIEGVLK
ncbi:MAG: CoB--CoM heterodisulfide reductase iron-sulfur subunit A family protein [Deltaproteobacteria bacterium]|jgi:heterodisulfide reductase subunit A|nr:CoB--CoM heterodisulfide reductase iron-sulfur subunit A family protein [Deltaproteobacteria bacterium]MBW2530237.1 CoB--CoM heterodisulfide reductase iron-sulfur subunit A family protein [Deltaproteobacteria bacterium]